MVSLKLASEQFPSILAWYRIEFSCPVKLRYPIQEHQSLYLEKDCRLHQKIDFSNYQTLYLVKGIDLERPIL
jgi:hypothetical protein